MANERPTDFPTLTSSGISLSDFITLIDVSDTTDNASGSDKKMTVSELRATMRRMFGIPEHVISTETETNSSNTTWVDITGVSWPVVSGRKYWFRVMGIYQTAVTTTGMQLQFSGPTLTANTSPTIYRARQAASGVGSFFDAGQVGTLTPGASAGVTNVNVDYPFSFEGVIEPSSTTTMQLQFRSEINTTAVQIRPGCAGQLFDLTGT